MSSQDWMYKASAPLLVASAKAGLTGAKKDQINGLAWIKAKHEELTALDPADATREFQKLDRNAQDVLKQIYGDTTYAPEEQSFFGRVWDVATKPVEKAFDAFTGYTEFISTPFRAAAAGEGAFTAFFDGKVWEKYSDGKRVFDAEREAIVDRAYAPEIAKIAKRMSIGDSFGDIIQELETDAEFAAMEKFLSGTDQTAKNALRDYNDAKLSWGRSFAQFLNIEPQVGVSDQGLKGTAYKWVSGATDFIGDVAFDPLTWVGMPLKAINMARFGLNSLLRTELTITQKSLKALTFGRAKFGAEAAFQVPRVRRAFDEVGPLIATVRREGENAPAAARAMEEAERLYPFFNPLTVIELSKFGKEGVKDADTAMDFFKQSDAMDKILKGRSGEMSRVLPQYTVIRQAKRELASITRKITGYDRSIERVGAGAVDNAIEQIQEGVSGAQQLQIDQLKTNMERTRFWVNRAASKSMTEGYIYMDGFDAAGRSMHLKSVDTIYNLARSFMDRYHARLVANVFAVSKDAGERRKIVSGIFETMADQIGIPKTGKMRQDFDAILDKWRNAVYSEEGAVTDDLIQAGLFPEGTMSHNPGIVDGVPQAVADHHLQNAAAIPNFHEIMDVYNKGMRVRSVSNTVNNGFVSALTDFWSALNLLPRLGLRSAIDENLFHVMTMPVMVMKDVLKGYQVSIGRRIVKKDPRYTRISGVDALGKAFNEYKKTGSISDATRKAAEQEVFGQRDIGILARVMQKFIVDLTPAERRKALSNDLYAAQLLKRELTRSRFNWAKLSKEEAGWVEDMVRFGHVNEIDSITSGFNAGVSSGVPLGRAQQAQIYDLNPYVADELKEKGFEFGRFFDLVYKHDIEYTANYLIQLSNRVDRNGIVGKLAVEFIDDPARAVDEIINYLNSEAGKTLMKRYERAEIQDVRQFAIDRYMHVRNAFTADDGSLIPELIDLVRRKTDSGDLLITANDVRPENISMLVDKLPSRIMGYKREASSKPNLANWLERFFDEGFRVADRQVATLSREPVTYAYNLFYRKEFSGAEKRYVEKLVGEGMDRQVAELAAAQRYSFLANEMALNRAGGFMDNPNLRSNVAYSARNLARYYRATEDFWRRVRRATSPESIVRLRMASEGLDNAGFIHEDDQGEKYFVMPVDEIMYAVYAPIIKALTGEEPKAMMPVKFTGKVKMLTPSLDPESALPTFSSPFMSLSVGLLAPLLPEELADDFTRNLLGSKAEGQTLADALTPALLRRVGQFVNANTGGMNEQLHSAAMKSIAFYASNGMAPSSDATPAEREQFIRDVKATARNIVAIRNLLGIFSPVSPGMADIKGIPKDLLEVGFSSFKAEFNELVGSEFAAGNTDAYNSALRKWTRLYPGRLVYTVSETQMNTVGAVKKTKNAMDWVQSNRALVDDFRQASVFLMPQNAGFDWDAYAFMKREGYIESKTLEKFMEDVANVADENAYFDIAEKYDTLMEQTANPASISYLRNQKEMEQKNFRDARPYLKLKLEKSQAERPVELKRQTLQEMRELLSSGRAPRVPSTEIIREMIAEFDRSMLVVGALTGQTDGELAMRKRVRDEAANRIEEIAGINPNALAFYNAVLKRLLNQ